MSIMTVIDGVAGITAACLIPLLTWAGIALIRWSARLAVCTWREITPEPHISEQIAAAVVRRLRRMGTS